MDPSDKIRFSKAQPEEPEECFRILVDGIREYGIFMLHSDGLIATWNAGAQRLTAFGSEEALGRSMGILFQPDDVNELKQIFQAAEIAPLQQECCLVRKDGVHFDAEMTLTPLRHGDGNLRGFACVIRDVTRRKRADEALRASEQKLKAVLNQAPIGIGLCDSQGHLFALNDLMRPYVGSVLPSRDPVFRLRWRAFDENGNEIESTDWPGARALRGEVVSPGLEMLFTRADGSQMWTRVAAAPLRDATGTLIGATLAVQDIDHLKRVEEALRDYTRRLLEEDRRKNEFLATMAHELRNPLAPIRNAVEILKRPDISKDNFRLARDITERQVDQMERLINDLLDVSRITRGKIDLKKERITLHSIVEQALETSQPHIERMGQRITLSLPSAHVYFDADPVRLAQALSNLIDNASKFSAPNSRIHITAEVAQGRRRDSQIELILSVKDNGIGIAPEHLPRLFEMFSQVASALERSQGGLGVGLSLVRALVEMHGGIVKANSEGIGKGSEFTIRLPVLDVDVSESAENNGNNAAA
jgi:PAS domain S-box-containing protein